MYMYISKTNYMFSIDPDAKQNTSYNNGHSLWHGYRGGKKGPFNSILLLLSKD